MFTRFLRIPDNMSDAEVQSLLNREFRFDKIIAGVVVSLIIVISSAIGSILWSFNAKVSALELNQAELRGAQTTILQNIKELQDRGSSTAQRTEILVSQLSGRFDRVEEFVSKGPRFTREDGDRLEKRVERIEEAIRSIGGRGK